MSFRLCSKNGVNKTITFKDTIPSDACRFIRNSTSLKRIEFHQIDIGGDDRTTYNYLSAIFRTSEYNIVCPTLNAIEIALPRKELLRRRHFGIIIDFMKIHPNTLWSLDLAYTTLGDGCVDLIVGAMNSGLRIGTLKMRGEFVGDDEMEKLLSSDCHLIGSTVS